MLPDPFWKLPGDEGGGWVEGLDPAAAPSTNAKVTAANNTIPPAEIEMIRIRVRNTLRTYQCREHLDAL